MKDLRGDVEGYIGAGRIVGRGARKRGMEEGEKPIEESVARKGREDAERRQDVTQGKRGREISNTERDVWHGEHEEAG